MDEIAHQGWHERVHFCRAVEANRSATSARTSSDIEGERSARLVPTGRRTQEAVAWPLPCRTCCGLWSWSWPALPGWME